jgi:hypothetical protein
MKNVLKDYSCACIHDANINIITNNNNNNNNNITNAINTFIHFHCWIFNPMDQEFEIFFGGYQRSAITA